MRTTLHRSLTFIKDMLSTRQARLPLQ